MNRPVLALVIWLTMSVAGLAQAPRVRVATAHDGFLGTFRVLADGARPPDTAPGAIDCDGCRASASASRVVDLRQVASRGATWVDLGVRLEAPRAIKLRLLLGARGGLEVWLDGARRESIQRARLREDDALVELSLPTGEHELVLRALAPEEGSWGLQCRVLDGRLRPGLGVIVADIGVLTETQTAALMRAAVALTEEHVLVGGTPTARLSLGHPAGGPRRAIDVRIGDEPIELRPSLGLFGMPAIREVPVPARGPLRVPVEVGGEPRRVGELLAIDRPLLAAMAALAAVDAPPASEAPLQWRYDELERCIRQGEPDRAWRRLLADESGRLAREVAAGRDPFGRLRGYVRMAHTSRLDGSAQPYELFVPPDYSDRREWPLVVTLHGFKGNAGDYFRNTFGLPRDYTTNESLEHHGRHGAAPETGPMIVVAPEGRGQSMYRHAGEIDVLEAIADVRARLRVDPRRVYITGGSMGGTGAAYLPFRHPDVFAASAALAGYHDQRVREDTHHAGLTEPERFMQAMRSDVDWTENALHLPMLLVRGTRDRPLEWTRRQASRLRELGYRFEHREPELGHNVWTDTYLDGAIFRWFEAHRLPAAPTRVRLRTARERTSSAYWVRIDGRSAPDAFATVDASIEARRVTATIEGADGVTFSPSGDGPLTVVVGGEELTGPAPLSIHREGARWVLGALDARGRKQSGVSGPIRDVFHEPLLFVVGSQDPNHTAMNLATAEDWAHPRGWDVRYPIVRDTEVTDEMIATHVLVLIGPPSSNALHARYAERLPIRYQSRAVTIGTQTFAGDEVGAAFVVPNPDHPDRSLLVIAGATPLGTWRARSLPDVLPDYVVYDGQVANARGQWSCGGARRDDGSENGAEPVPCSYLRAGFFDMRWQLPSTP